MRTLHDDDDGDGGSCGSRIASRRAPQPTYYDVCTAAAAAAKAAAAAAAANKKRTIYAQRTGPHRNAHHCVRSLFFCCPCVCSRARAGASQATPSPWIVGTDSVLCTLCVARARAIRGPAYASCCGDDSAHRCGCCWMLMMLWSSMPMPSVSVSGDGAVACVWVVWWAKLFAADRRAVQISWRICFCSSFCCCTSD